MPPQSGATRPGLRAAAEGTAFIRRSPLIAGVFLADLTATVFGLPAALFPAINAERFGGDSRTLGLFTTAIGLGGLASAAFSGLVTHVSRQGRAMLCAVAAWGAAIAGFAVAPSLWLTLSLLATAERPTPSPWCSAAPSSPPPPPGTSAAGSSQPTTLSARAAGSSATSKPGPWDR